MTPYSLLITLLTTSLCQSQVPPPPQTSGNFRVESFGPGTTKTTDNVVTNIKGEMPKVIYGSSRQSKAFVTTRQGNQAVDDGITWEGKRAYLSLTYELIVLDNQKNEFVWSTSVGAFWDVLTIANAAETGKPPVYVLELGSTRHPEYKQRFDLSTGKQLALIGNLAMPVGTPIKPRLEFRGSAGLVDGKEYQLVSSSDDWSKLRNKLFPADTKSLPADKDIDFTKEVVLVCYAGKTFNWNGISSELVMEDDQRILVRLHRHTYQSMGQTPDTYPYGIIVLPKKPEKDYVLEYNRQNLIGGPPLWKHFLTLKLPK